MKYLLTVLTLLVLQINNVFCQVTQGYAQYEVNISTDDEEMKQALSMMENSSMNIYFTKQRTRTEFDMGMIKTTTITDAKEDQALILMDMMGMKIAMDSKISKLQEGNEDQIDAIKIEITSDHKKILGYNCQKAVVYSDDLKMEYWYTEEIEISKSGQELFNKELPGFPMLFEVSSEGLKMSFTISKFSKEFEMDAEKYFDRTVPEGYKVMSPEDLESMGM